MNNVILIGFMGCGKTTVGIKLSYRLRMPFLDTDKEIEKEQRKQISDIFEKEGEDFFRDLETGYLQSLQLFSKNQVISTGGGLPLREENRRLLKQLGITVYLKAKPGTIYERLKGDKNRPLLQGKNPEEKIQALMVARESVYAETADITVTVDDKSFSEIILEIEEALQ